MSRLVYKVSRLLNAIRLRSLPGHKANVVRAGRVLYRLRGMRPAQGFSYLRQVDSAVMEELVLSLFERHGTLVLRNRRYTGDGGIDGRIWVPRVGLMPVQTKRYSSAINPAHVRSFCELVVKQSYTGGILAHTGRTGDMSKTATDLDQRVLFLSGGALWDAIQGTDPLVLLGLRPPPAARSSQPAVGARARSDT